MINNTAIASFEGSRRGYFFPMCKEEMISGRQLRTLTELIMQNIEDEESKEGYLAQINDLTASEANKMILEFTMAKW
jgi:hypothetical protein